MTDLLPFLISFSSHFHRVLVYRFELSVQITVEQHVSVPIVILGQVRHAVTKLWFVGLS